MNKENLFTEYAPAERSSLENARTQNSTIFDAAFIKEILESTSDVSLILNKNRQIIYSNQVLLEFLNINDFKQIINLRPGEALGCIHIKENSSGCGTTLHCKYCGAVNAIWESQQFNKKVSYECVIEQKDNNALNLHVTASPLHIGNEDFTIITLKDISDKKRRIALEKIFFHDVINTASGLNSLAHLTLQKKSDSNFIEQSIPILSTSSSQLLNEIISQKNLSMAENGELTLSFVDVNSLEILNDIVGLYMYSELSKGIHLFIDTDSESISFHSDISILKRILENLIKNAIEASTEGCIVKLECNKKGNYVEFKIHNQQEMPESVKMQMFKRSYSTKGKNRGLGTYSAKLLTEKYLDGKLFFESEPMGGTTFYVQIPI